MKNRDLLTFICSCTFILSAFCTTSSATAAETPIPCISITDSSGAQQSTYAPGDSLIYTVTFPLEQQSLLLFTASVRFPDNNVDRTKLYVSLSEQEKSVCWTGTVPDDAAGRAEVVVTSLILPGKFVIARKDFEVSRSGDDRDNPSFICSACHGDNYRGWKETRHYPAVGCELCHGSGQNHITAPSSDTISIPTGDICNTCHSGNDGTVIEASNGFINAQQQRNELEDTAHGSVADCCTCHNPHYSPSNNKASAIKLTCRQCHPQKDVYLNMQSLDCEDCHMAPAVSKGDSSGSGLYKKGDTPSHLFRIKTEAAADTFLTPDGTAASKDIHGPFLTVDRACLHCHNGFDAGLQTFDSVQQTSTIVH